MSSVTYQVLRNKRYVSILTGMLTEQELTRIGRAAVGVLGHTTAKGLPNAVTITPYVVDGRLVVTSTLALIQKAAALLADPRVTLSAGGVVVEGVATVEVDPTPQYFDRFIRALELRKFPPARPLLALPFHRTLLSWYVGRVIIQIQPQEVLDQQLGDAVTVTGLDVAGRLWTRNIPSPSSLSDGRVDLSAAVADGPALLLLHEEDVAMRDLRQMAVRGVIGAGVLEVTARRGSLDPSSKSSTDELRSLRHLARAAKRNRALLATWPRYTPNEDHRP
jgi:hypothetical protein